MLKIKLDVYTVLYAIFSLNATICSIVLYALMQKMLIFLTSYTFYSITWFVPELKTVPLTGIREFLHFLYYKQCCIYNLILIFSWYLSLK